MQNEEFKAITAKVPESAKLIFDDICKNEGLNQAEAMQKLILFYSSRAGASVVNKSENPFEVEEKSIFELKARIYASVLANENDIERAYSTADRATKHFLSRNIWRQENE